MRIEFVNHASLIFSCDNISLICDPWIEGKVFDNGWSLLSKTKFGYQDFERITHIWFSHEHPDHFFPPNIKSIPAEIRKKIVVLYQQTNDKKVIEFCRKLEFKDVIELNPHQEYKLSGKFRITNGLVGHDSWLYIKTDKDSFLNTNDCVVNSPEIAKRIASVIGEADTLLTQFSYAAKHGNTDEPQKRRQAVADKFDELKIQFEAFKVKRFIPIASFVWFSHEENFYMNDEINRIDRVEKFSIASKVQPVVLYPGEIYSGEALFDNSSNIEKHLKDLDSISVDQTTKTASVSLDVLKESADKLRRQLRREDWVAFLAISFFPVKFYLTDLNKVVRFSALSGFRELHVGKEKANLQLSSEVLNYCLKFNWGFGTTNVNGRFQTTNDKDLILFNYYVSVTDSLNHGDSSMKRIIHKIGRKLRSIFRKR